MYRLAWICLLACCAGCSNTPPEDPSPVAEPAASDLTSSENGETESTKSNDSESSSSVLATSPTKDQDSPKKTDVTRRANSGKPETITFDDINIQLQADMVFRPWLLTDRVKELEGRRVRIAGYMLPDMKQDGITSFVLLRNNECLFGPGGQADHLISVNLDEDTTTRFRVTPIQVEGTFKIEPFEGVDGNTWAIYELNAANNIVTVRQ